MKNMVGEWEEESHRGDGCPFPMSIMTETRIMTAMLNIGRRDTPLKKIAGNIQLMMMIKPSGL